MDLDRWHLENFEKEFNLKDYKSYIEKNWLSCKGGS